MHASLDTFPASDPKEQLAQFNQLFLGAIEPKFQLTTSVDLELLRIEVTKLGDQTESATLLDFAASYCDLLMDCAIRARIPRVQILCGANQYPQFTAVRFRELGLKFRKFNYCG